MSKIELHNKGLRGAGRFDWWCAQMDQDLAPTRMTTEVDAFQAAATLLEIGKANLSVLDDQTGLNSRIMLHLPRRLLPLQDQPLQKLAARSLPSSTGTGGLLARFLQTLTEQATALPAVRSIDSAQRQSTSPLPSSPT